MNLAGAPDVLTISEAANVLRCSRGVAYEMARRGDLPTVRLGARILRVPTHALRQMLAATGTDSPNKENGTGAADAV